MKKRWRILPCDETPANALHAQLNVSKTLCRILAQRGLYDFSSSKGFFVPELAQLHDPMLMKDMDKAVARIDRAIAAGEKILVFGDYDVDGTTAVAIMYSFLREIYDADKLDYYIPHRYREGYGISRAGIEFAAANDFTLVIALDCGIKSVELIDAAATAGIDFIVCDHHLPGNELPPAAAILNAKQADCNYPFKDLCGCGVGFKLMTALTLHYNLPQEMLYKYLDLVATAIAADIVSMTGENRILTYHGLEKINNDPIPGIRALQELAAVNKRMTINNVVFVIAPRVNAAGRMDDARKAVQLFIEKDWERALEYAGMLHSDNNDRREADSSITEDALLQIKGDEKMEARKSCVVYSDRWHKGVVGIVASRLIEHYHRPTIVLTVNGDMVTGSARSVSGFNLYDAVYECRDLLTAYGGHYAAAGLSMPRKNLEAFIKKFDEVVSATIHDDLLTPEILIDAEIEFSEITPAFYAMVARMEPFGPGNSNPIFVARNCRDLGHSRIVKDAHLKLVLKQNDTVLSGIGFRMAEHFALLKNQEPVDVVFTIDENEWQGNKTIQMKVLDLRPATGLVAQPQLHTASSVSAV